MEDLSRQSNGDLLLVGNLREYFRDSIDAAMVCNRITLTEQTRHYIVNLLIMYSRSEELYEQTAAGPQLRPLAAMLSDAIATESDAERRYLLQRMGDVALFVGGFFSDSLQQCPVDLDYYVRMGSSAYHSLSTQLRGSARGRSFVGIFTELADRFQDIVDVLHEVREADQPGNHVNVLRLYELWLRTGSRRAGRLLRELGIQPYQQAWGQVQH